MISLSKAKLARAAAFGAPFLIVALVTAFFIRGLSFLHLVEDLSASSLSRSRPRVFWTEVPLRKTSGPDYIRIVSPQCLENYVRTPFGRLVAAPFSAVEEVCLDKASPSALEILAKCHSMRFLTLRNIDGGTRREWNQVLNLRLDHLWLGHCSLPSDALNQLENHNSITNLLISVAGPFDKEGWHALGRCTQLETLGLQYLKETSDQSLATALRGLVKLKRIDLNGVSIGQKTVESLAALPLLDEAWIIDSKLPENIFGSLTHFSKLRTLTISRSAIDDANLMQLSELKSLKTCNVQGSKLSAAAIEQFRVKRPDVELNILGFVNNGTEPLLK